MAKKKKQTKKQQTKSRSKKSNLDVAYIVESEGLDYAITGYMGSEDFEDPRLAKLWDEATVVLGKIEGILQDAMEQNQGVD